MRAGQRARLDTRRVHAVCRTHRHRQQIDPGLLDKLGYNVEVTSFNNGDDVLNWQGQPWDVMFMDIELGEEKTEFLWQEN